MPTGQSRDENASWRLPSWVILGPVTWQLKLAITWPHLRDEEACTKMNASGKANCVALLCQSPRRIFLGFQASLQPILWQMRRWRPSQNGSNLPNPKAERNLGYHPSLKETVSKTFIGMDNIYQHGHKWEDYPLLTECSDSQGNSGKRKGRAAVII